MIDDTAFNELALTLMLLPSAVAKVVGTNQIYIEYKVALKTLEVTVFYRRLGGLGERIDFELTKSSYSPDELEAMVVAEYDWADHWYNHHMHPCGQEDCPALRFSD